MAFPDIGQDWTLDPFAPWAEISYATVSTKDTRVVQEVTSCKDSDGVTWTRSDSNQDNPHASIRRGWPCLVICDRVHTDSDGLRFTRGGSSGSNFTVGTNKTSVSGVAVFSGINEASGLADNTIYRAFRFGAWQLAFVVWGGKLYLGVADATSPYYQNGGNWANIPLTASPMVVGYSYDGTTFRLYVNGYTFSRVFSYSGTAMVGAIGDITNPTARLAFFGACTFGSALNMTDLTAKCDLVREHFGIENWTASRKVFAVFGDSFAGEDDGFASIVGDHFDPLPGLTTINYSAPNRTLSDWIGNWTSGINYRAAINATIKGGTPEKWALVTAGMYDASSSDAATAISRRASFVSTLMADGYKVIEMDILPNSTDSTTLADTQDFNTALYAEGRFAAGTSTLIRWSDIFPGLAEPVAVGAAPAYLRGDLLPADHIYPHIAFRLAARVREIMTLPPANKVLMGVDRGDGVMGTLAPYPVVR